MRREGGADGKRGVRRPRAALRPRRRARGGRRWATATGAALHVTGQGSSIRARWAARPRRRGCFVEERGAQVPGGPLGAPGHARTTMAHDDKGRGRNGGRTRKESTVWMRCTPGRRPRPFGLARAWATTARAWRSYSGSPPRATRGARRVGTPSPRRGPPSPRQGERARAPPRCVLPLFPPGSPRRFRRKGVLLFPQRVPRRRAHRWRMGPAAPARSI